MREHDPHMVSLLRLSRICPTAMDVFAQTISLDDNGGASYKLLAETVKRVVKRNKPADEQSKTTVIGKVSPRQDTAVFLGPSHLGNFKLSNLTGINGRILG